MELNQRFLLKLQESLALEGSALEEFTRCLREGVGSQPSVLWTGKPRPAAREWEAVPSPFFDIVERHSENCQPGVSVAHEAGEIYCLDHSSVFSMVPLYEVGSTSSVLDVCASPGGKSMLAWSFLRPDFLVANEVVRKRVKILISNLKRCSVGPSAVAALDSSVLAAKFPEAFDLVLVDAPCSGQSLLARGAESPGCLNPAVIKKNAGRQKRILANAIQCLSPGGYLIYSTCTFSIQENEKIIEWILKKSPHLEAVKVKKLSDFISPYAESPCYRLFPHQKQGAGAFTALLHCTKEKVSGDLQNLLDMKYAWRCDDNR